MMDLKEELREALKDEYMETMADTIAALERKGYSARMNPDTFNMEVWHEGEWVEML